MQKQPQDASKPFSGGAPRTATRRSVSPKTFRTRHQVAGTSSGRRADRRSELAGCPARRAGDNHPTDADTAGGLNSSLSTAGRRLSGTPSAQRRGLVARRAGQRPDPFVRLLQRATIFRGRPAFCREPAELVRPRLLRFSRRIEVQLQLVDFHRLRMLTCGQRVERRVPRRRVGSASPCWACCARSGPGVPRGWLRAARPRWRSYGVGRGS